MFRQTFQIRFLLTLLKTSVRQVVGLSPCECGDKLKSICVSGNFLFVKLSFVYRKSGISPTSAPTKWQSIQRIVTETDIEMSVHVSEQMRKFQAVYSLL